jgi:dipeptidyl aminopeptidase/acylaminoacyl peptidase
MNPREGIDLQDERKIGEELETQHGHLDPSQELRGMIKRESRTDRYHVPSLWVARLVACLTTGVVILNGCFAQPTSAATLTLIDPSNKVYMAGVNGRRVTELPVEVDSYSSLYITWSPDGRYLVYGKAGDLFLYDDETKENRNLTNTPDRWELMPSWSPQGKRIAFVSRPLDSGEGQPARPGAYPWVMKGCFCGSPTVIEPNGSGYHVLDEHGVTGNPLSWSPDGTKVVYGSEGKIRTYDIQTGQVNVVEAETHGLHATYVGAPSWSPTRNELAVFFSQGSHEPPSREAILSGTAERAPQGYAILDLNQRSAHILHRYQAPFVYRPPALWSSDGNRIALVYKQELIVREPMAVVIVDREGRHSQTVAKSVYQAAWEPVGSRFAYLGADNLREIKILTPTDSGWQTTRREFAVPLQGFAWRPDQD